MSMNQKKAPKPMFNEHAKQSGKPKHMDSKSVHKGAPDQVGHKKAAGGATHKGMDGPSEMASTHGGPHHTGLHGNTAVPVKQVANMAGDQGHLGKHGSVSSLKKGHTSLEKVNVHGASAMHSDGESYEDGADGQYGKKK